MRRSLKGGPILLALALGSAAGIGGYTFSYAKGLSYFSHDPRACVNCHIMQREYDGWQKSGHHHVAGPTAALGLDYRVFDNRRYFLVLTSSFSFATARTQLASEATVAYTAFDLRVGAQGGLQLANIFRPYAVVRAFGGPVHWRYQGEAVTGNDAHHYQVGAGLGVRITRSLSLVAEGVPLGEQAVSLGAGFV